MAVDLPNYFFRTRDAGASVFRVDTGNRHRRIEMEQIATIVMRTGEVRAHGDRKLSDEDKEAIKTWIADREETLEWRKMDDILRHIDQLHHTAHWVQSTATNEQLDMVTDTLLMAMHDLRTVLVRKKAERVLDQGKN